MINAESELIDALREITALPEGLERMQLVDQLAERPEILGPLREILKAEEDVEAKL